MAISVSATESALLTTDTDGDGVADPGETLTFSVTITNTSNASEILTGVQFEQLLSGVTLVPGSINVSPLANNDAFSAVGNTLLEVGNATAQTGPQTSFAGNLFSNDTEFLGDTFTLSTFDATSANGGQVAVNADGTFTYISAAGFTGDDTFTYTLTDGDGLTSTATVTITVADQVWYVDGNAAPGGDGTSTNPFNTVTLADAQSGANDYVYVQNSAGGEIVLAAGEQLIGTGVDLVVGGNTLATATANSAIASTSAGFAVSLNNGPGNTIAGIDIGNTVGGGITGLIFGTLTVDDVAIDTAGQALSLTTGSIAGAGFNSVDSDGGANNVSLTGVSGNLNLGGGALSGATGSAVLISGGNGSVDFNGTVTHSGNAVAIQVLNKTGGSVDFDGAVTSNGNSDGVSLTNNTGATINFDGGLTIDTSLSGTAGFTATGGGTVNVTGGANTIAAASTAIDLSGVTAGMAFSQVTSTSGATGISLNSMAGGLTIGSVSINGQSGDGIDITNSAGSLTINGGTIGNSNDPGGVGVDINGGTGAVSIAASLTKTSAGNLIEVTNHSTGDVTFSGALSAAGGAGGILLDGNSGEIDFTNGLKSLNTGTANGVTITNNAANVDFTGGGLAVTTTSGTGISAGTTGTSTGGTLTISGAGNTISSGTGSAFVLNGTDSDGITFQSISKNGGTATGVFIRDAGAGGFTVTGTGSTANSGGTLQNIGDGGVNGSSSAGLGVYVENTSNLSFSNMLIGNGTAIENFGIRGLNVVNFTLRDSVVNGTLGDTSGSGVNLEGGIYFNNLTGVGLFEGNNISGGFTDNMRILNDAASGTLNLFVRDSANDAAIFGSNGTTNSGNDSLNVEVNNDGNVFMLVDGVQFTAWRGDGIQASALGTANLEATVQNSTFFNTHPNIASGGGIGVLIGGTAGGGSWGVDYTVQNNQISGSQGVALAASFNGFGGTARGIITGNTIGTPGGGYTGSGSAQGAGIFVSVERSGVGSGSLEQYATISNNTIRDVAGTGIYGRATNGSSLANNAVAELTILNNTIAEMGGPSSLAGIRLLAGGNDPDFGIMRADITGNNINIDGTTNAYAPIFLDQIFGTNSFFVLPGHPGDDFDTAATDTYFDDTKANDFVLDAGQLDPGSEVYSADAIINNGSLQAAQTGSNTQLPSGAIEAAAPPPPPADETPVVETPAAGGEPGPQPDLAPSGPAPSGPVVVDDGVLSASELGLIVEAAIARWADAGATAAQLAAMRAVTVSVADLGALQLGGSTLGTIVIDDNAAGWNWFVDATPGDDAEYAGAGTQLTAIDTSAQAGTRIDLLTVLMHELGHQIGLADTYNANDAEGLMFGAINAGERRLPGAGESVGATPPTGGATQYIGAPIVIGTLNPGQSLTITWQATIDAQSNGLIVNPSNSGTVSWTGPSAGSQPTNAVVTVLDTLTLGDLVFLDVNGNGMFDAGDNGIDGVTLSLFVDAGNDGTPDGAAIATAMTAGGGLYSFAGLAPGDYLVQVDAANFTAGGALEGNIATTPAGDPDDDVDNDSNAGALTGGVVNSGTITLAYNTEPTADDTNTTLDLGFVAPNQAPVNSLGGTIGTGEDAVDAWLSGMSISDPDADPAADDVRVTFEVQHGSLAILTNVAGGIVAGDIVAQDADTITVQATLNEINATLAAANGLTYTPTTNFNGEDTLTVTSNDRGFSGVDPGLTGDATSEEDVDTRTITVSATNDAPVVVGDGTEEAAAIVEDAPSATGETVSALFSGQYSDAADAQFSLGNPTGSSPGSFGGIAVVANGSSGATGQWQYFDTGTATWVDVGAVSAASALLIGSGTSIRFDPAQDFEGAAPTLTAHLIDNSLGFGITFGQHADISGVGATGGTTAYSTATVVLSQTVTSDGTIEGTGGDDTVTGTAGDDYIDVSQGGNDTVDALDGADRLYYGAALTAADSNDGGAGLRDALILQGNYALTLGATSLVGIEYLSLQSGSITRWGDTAGNTYTYDITTVEANVTAGQRLVVNGQSLEAGETFTFDGSAETDGGTFLLYGGRATDTFTGGSGDDIFYFEEPRWNLTDTIDGGDGTDALVISMGDGVNHIEFGETQFTNIEALSVNNRFASDPVQMPSYELVLKNGNVALDETLIVNGSSLEATQTLNVDGSQVVDGLLRLYGGADDDVFVGGAKADLIYAAGGSDTSTGGTGADTFQYRDAADSAVADADQILDFEIGTDRIDLSFIDPDPGAGGDQSFAFVGAAAFTPGNLGEVRAEFDGGAGVWRIEGDTNGDATADFLILVTATTADPITAADFVL